jgi:predicted component of type VI protein secretion system
MFVAQITSFDLIISGPSVQKAIRLTQQPLTIGRSKNAMPDVEIDEAEAAARHCVVQWNGDGQCHALRVFGPSGVWLNGSLLPGDGVLHSLAVGSRFTIGATTFEYRAAPIDVEPAGDDPPTVLAGPTLREVYEFEVIPKNTDDGTDWQHALMSYGPRQRAEAPIQALRVVVSKGTPRTAILAALRNITDLVEASTQGADRGPSQLATLARWLDT